MAAERRQDVLRTSLRTSAAALRDPEPLAELATRIEFDEAG
jgi:hypothetical protein